VESQPFLWPFAGLEVVSLGGPGPDERGYERPHPFCRVNSFCGDQLRLHREGLARDARFGTAMRLGIRTVLLRLIL